MPDAPSSSSELLARLNSSWQVAGPEPTSGQPAGRRLLFRVRKMIASLLRPQETFNSTLVQYLNVRGAEQDERLQTHKDTLTDALARAVQSLDRAMHDADDRRLASEEELRAEGAAVAAELRTSITVLQRASQMVQRQLTGRGEHGAVPAAGAASALPGAGPLGALDSHKYVGFEDQFRGTPEDIRARQSAYLPILQGAADVLDIGCGRGEFLALLREQGISARGIDLNAAMVGVCRDQGLEATVADALTYLRAQPDNSLGGLVAAQVIEHLEPGYLMAFLDAALDTLRPGAPIILETINPTSWVAFFDSYLRDFTHVRPIHPETLQYLLIAAGFQHVEIKYSAPYPEARKLQTLQASGDVATPLQEWAATINANAAKLNQLLFSWLDFAAVARKP